MEKCVLLWLGRRETEPLSWIATELKDHLAYTKDYEVTRNAVSGSQIIYFLAFQLLLLIREDKVISKH